MSLGILIASVQEYKLSNVCIRELAITVLEVFGRLINRRCIKF